MKLDPKPMEQLTLSCEDSTTWYGEQSASFEVINDVESSDRSSIETKENGQEKAMGTVNKPVAVEAEHHNAARLF